LINLQKIPPKTREVAAKKQMKKYNIALAEYWHVRLTGAKPDEKNRS